MNLPFAEKSTSRTVPGCPLRFFSSQGWLNSVLPFHVARFFVFPDARDSVIAFSDDASSDGAPEVEQKGIHENMHRSGMRTGYSLVNTVTITLRTLLSADASVRVKEGVSCPGRNAAQRNTTHTHRNVQNTGWQVLYTVL